MKLSYVLAAPLFLALCAMPASARAQQSEHNSGQHMRDGDRVRAQQHLREERERRIRREREEREIRLRREREARWRREHRSERRDGFRDRDHDRRSGWRQGKKEGWHGDPMPPGQTKKADYQKHHGR